MNSLTVFRKNCLPAICLIGSLLFFVHQAQALGFAESLDHQIERAELIFIGTVEEIRSYKKTEVIFPFASNRERSIETETLYTDYVFKIDEVLKGDYKGTGVAISQMGGFDRGQRLFPSIAYFLGLREQYIVIAVKTEEKPHRWVAASGGQGVFNQYEKDGVTYLKNVNSDSVIEKPDEPGSVIEDDVSMETFLMKVKEGNK
jgi:hypothetical protein